MGEAHLLVQEAVLIADVLAAGDFGGGSDTFLRGSGSSRREVIPSPRRVHSRAAHAAFFYHCSSSPHCLSDEILLD